MMKAPIDTSDNADVALEQLKSRSRSTKQSCQRCKVIRLFLVAAACIGILQLIAPDTFTILQGLEPLTLSILFVGGFGIIAIVTSVAEYWATRTDDSGNQL